MTALHRMRTVLGSGVSVAVVLLAWGCGDDGVDGGGGAGGQAACDPQRQTGCAEGEACEEVEDGTTACFAPINVTGRVFDFVTDEPIASARVVARDENGASLSTVVETAADGTYSLPVPAKRKSDGTPLSRSFTLRADAATYQSFPLAPRVALPLDLADATGEPLILQQPNSDIGLIPLGDTTGLGTISGTVVADVPGGTLVDAGGRTGIADRDGAFVVFNVPAGSVQVAAYKQGLNFEGASVEVAADTEATGVTLTANDQPAVDVSGSVHIVNAMGGTATSVILVLESTFDETLVRGEAPPGLRAGSVTGTFSIPGVPNGSYVVLAGFENDGLVRDPDTSIGGTEIVRIDVDGAAVSISEGFKVTGALAVVSPGADDIEEVSGDVTFTWEDDSSEDEYRVQVFDALGTLVWETTGNFDPGGNDPASVAYGGPALTNGMLYQFRATSIKDGVPISSTEDLRGVFVVQ
jgi:hypothetical protein